MTPTTDKECISLVESMGEQWVENRLCAETVEEMFSIDHWYLTSVTTVVNTYCRMKLLEMLGRGPEYE